MSQEGQPRMVGDVRHGLGASLGRATEFKQAKLAPTFAVLAAVGLLLAFAPSALAVEGGQITGKVTSASSNAVITGIEVCAAESVFEAELLGHCATTNSSGEYSISELPAGSYGVGFFSPEGSGLNYITQFYNGKSSIGEAELFVVEPGKTVSGINAAMQVGGQITGKVTDASSKAAIAGIQACASLIEGEAFGCAKTASNGEYTVSGLPSGAYKVFFSSPEGSALNYLSQYYNGKVAYAEASPVSTTAGSTKSGIDAAMVAGGQITGKVTEAAGSKSALANIQVSVYEAHGFFPIAFATTNSSGEYTVSGLATGEYKVGFSPAGGANYVAQFYNGKSSLSEANGIAVIAGSTKSGIDAGMMVGGEITGKVTAGATKAGLAGAQVCASSTSGGPGGCVTTNPGGEYTIVGLATGEYRVEFRPGFSCGLSGCTSQNYLTQYYNGKVSFSEAELVSVTAGSTALGVDAAMVEGGKITGKVTNSVTKASLGGIQVCPLMIGGGYSGQCATANSSGEYTIVGLATGEYKVVFSSSTGAYFTQYYNGTASSAEAAAIAVTAATTTSGIDAAMVEGGKITGKVTSAANKAGIEGVQVCAEREGLFGQCAQTNAAGEYTIIGLATGEYSVSFQPSSGNYLSQYYNGKSSASEANPVSVADSTTTSGINAVLAAGGQVIGKVTSAATKAGIEDVEVCASSSEEGGCAITGATGEYTINALPTGKYTVRFSVPYGSGLNYLPQYYNGATAFAEATPVSVTAGSAAANVDAAMAAGGQITGTVIDASSKSSAKGIQVCAWPTSAGESGGCTTSNASGEYDLNSLATGEYKVQFSVPYGSNLQYVEQYYNDKSSFSTADAVAVTAGATKTGIDAAMVLKGQITGKVTDATGSTPVSGIQVSVYQTSGFYPIAYATTNASGEYVVQGLATGEYKVEFSVPYGSGLNYLPQYYDSKQSLSEASAVSVSVGAVTGEVNAKLQAGGRITGKVTNASTKAALGGIQVCPQATTGGFAGRCVTSNASGDYTIVALSTAEYKVQFSSTSGANFVTQYYNDKSSVTEANPVSVTAGSTTPEINAAMVVGGKITGKLTDAATQAAVAGIQVCPQLTSGAFAGSCVTTNSSGEYTLAALAAGEYKVEFSVSYGSTLNYLPQYYNGKESSSEASPVSVTTGATTSGINAAMVAGGEITGKVTDAATKETLYNAEVCLEAQKSTFFGTCAFTNTRGEYAIASLPTGEYKVQFEAFSGGYSTQYYNNKGSASEAEPVSVTTGTTTAGINAALVVGGQVTGVVTSSATKTGIGGVQVCATSVGKEPFIRCASTSTGGEYTITGLATGEYKVEFNPISQNYLHQYYNGKESSSEASPVSVTTGATTSGVNAALAVGGEITGKVTNATSKAALGGVQVCPLTSTSSFIGQCTTSNSSGEYTLAGLATGEYKLEFYPTNGANYVPQFYNGKSSSSEATPVSVTAGATTSGINAAMVAGAQITGKVTNASSKAAAGGIDVCPRAPSSFFIQCAMTNSSGEYTLVGLGTGEYKIELNAAGQNYLPQYYNGKSLESEANPVSVTAGTTTTGVNAALIVGGEITGKVTEASTQAAIAGIEVCSSPTTGFGFFNRCTTTNFSGDYAIVALTTGEYDVRFSSPSNSYAVQYYNKKTSLTFANAVAVTTGSTTSAIDAELANLPVPIKAPVITGTAQQGHTLTEAHGSWTNNPTSYTYQWELCNSTGGECAAISGATEQTYVPVLADEGRTLRVTETAVNLAGSGSPATSAATSVVLPLPPVSTKSPSISGTAQQGKTLTEVHGTWENNPTSYTYQWLRCNEEGKSCTSISGATEETYVPVSLDVGHTLVVNEVAHNAGGPSIPAPSTATTVVVPPVPVNKTVPSVSGSAVQGKTLTEVHGSWENSPMEYRYQWEQCDGSGAQCEAISGATEQSYVLTSVDVGHTLAVEEIAINAGGPSVPASSVVTSKVVASPPVNVSPPSISGTFQQGQTLNEEHGSWTNEPTEYTYQWLRCDEEAKSCTSISGATNQSYAPIAADVGHTLEVQEIAHNAGGPSSPATSSPTSTVLPAAPVSTKPPTITGGAVQGQTLTEVRGAWENNPTNYEYQWLRCDSEGKNCTTIASATEQTYLLVTADVGHTLEVQETAINAGGVGQPAVSAKTATVAAAKPTMITPPSISGTAQQGQMLTEEHGTWTNEPTSYEYQWLRCNEEGKTCTAISGATGQTYQPAVADVGHTLEVSETARNAAGASSPVTSQASSVVLPAVPVNVTSPTVSGSAQQGQTLTQHHGTWENSPTGYAVTWEQCDSLGEGCLPITGAEGETYKPTALDVGHTIRAVEVASNAGGSGEPASSEPTALITSAPPVDVTPPTIIGTPQQGEVLADQHGTWTNEPTHFAYQWLLCSHEATECAPIAGAVDPTHSVAPTEVGHTLELQEAASNEGGESTPATSAPTAVVTPVPLNAVAGEAVTVVAGTGVSFDGSGSTPAAEIGKYAWDFGDSSTREGASVAHAYASPGTYTATLTITRGTETATASESITVTPAPVHAPVVEVTDSSHSPLPEATVLYIGPGGTRIQGATGGDGKTTLPGLPDGTDTVYAYKSGFQPAVGHVVVSGGGGETSIALSSGEVATSTLKDHEMTLKEIEEAGIDTHDPNNQNVYEFEVRLAFIETPEMPQPVQLHCFINKAGEFVGKCVGSGGCCGGGGGWGGFGGGGGGGGGGGPACSPHACVGGGIVAIPHIVDGHPMIQWLILRGKVTVLKQFFEVTQVIQNLSPEPFKLAPGHTTLNIPSGMSLAPTATPQTATQAVPEIPGNGSAEANWIVRGDEPGFYLLSANYESKLEPFEAPVDLEAQLASPLHIWGVEALSLSVQAEKGFLAEGQPYHVSVSVTNKADITLNNVEIAIFSNVHARFIFQPDQRFSEKIAELKPGETISAPLDILVPDAPSEAEFNPALSSVHFVGEEIHPGVGIETSPKTPLYSLVVNDESASKRVHLAWQADPNAEGYEVFSTPTLDTPFSGTPEQVKADPNGSATTELPANATEAYAPFNSDEPSKYYAVASVVHGKLTLDHDVMLSSFGTGAEDWGYCFSANAGIAYGAGTVDGSLCLVQSGNGAHDYLMTHSAADITIPTSLDTLTTYLQGIVSSSCLADGGASIGAIAFEGPAEEDPGNKTFGGVSASVNADIPGTHFGVNIKGAAFQSRDLSTFGIYYGYELSYGIGCLPEPLQAQAEPDFTFHSHELTGALKVSAAQFLQGLSLGWHDPLSPFAALGYVKTIGPPVINIVKKEFPGWYVALSGATAPPSEPTGIANWTVQSSSSDTEVVAPSTPDQSVLATGRGIGSLGVGEYDVVPNEVGALQAGSTYFDVRTSKGSLFDPVTITACNVSATDIPQWWTGKTWEKVSTYSYEPTTQCDTIALGENTKPSISQLGGTVFAIPPTPTPVCAASPVIGEQPANQTLTAPVEATFKVKEGIVPVSCSPASIQWQISTDGGSSWTAVSGTNFAGSTSPTLDINSTATSESGHKFRAVLSNTHGETDSVAATLTVNESPVVNQPTGGNSGGSTGTSPANSGSSQSSSAGNGSHAAGEVKGFKANGSTKPLTQTQKLTKALTACKKLKKSKRAKCEKRARTLYAPKPKHRKKH